MEEYENMVEKKFYLKECWRENCCPALTLPFGGIKE